VFVRRAPNAIGPPAPGSVYARHVLASTPANAPEAGSRLSRYTLERFLGAGAMGAVYCAVDDRGRSWALKVLLQQRGASTDALQRFFREAKVSANLESPNVVAVHEGSIDPESGFPYLVMPLLTGEDLASLLGRVGALDPATAIRITIQAARGLAAAHAAGVVHRDVKPANLFLHEEGDRIIVKVCDFGVAKALESEGELTVTGSTVGSPIYMSPEQLLSAKRVDARSDVWSLAMTLWEALAGKAALGDVQTLPELVNVLSTRDVPPIQDAAPWVEAGIAAAIHGALLRDLALRCPDVISFADALEPFAGDSTDLTADMMRGVSDTTRSQVADRAETPGSWTVVAATMSSSPRASRIQTSLVGQILGGQYTLVGVLGQGGMGAVYEAVDPQGNHFAIKVVLEDVALRSSDALRRFVREARAAMSIQSDNVVRVIEADTDPTRRVPYIVMELLKGTDLSSVIKKAGPLEPAAACAVFVQAARGLAAAHELGIVHRDIKPANIFLHELPSGEIVVKICDFGVAKQLQTGETDKSGTDLTRTGGMLGSPVYMSPEQARNAKNVDARTDVWSLSISLHEALTGVKPWSDTGSIGEIILSICTKDLTPLQDLAPWVEPALAETLHRGLIRDPAERCSSSAALAAALEPFALKSMLTRAALTALGEDKKRAIAPRARSSTTRDDTTGRGAVGPATGFEGAPKRGWTLPAMAIAAVVVAGTGFAVFRGSGNGAPAVQAASAEPAPRATAAARFSPRVLVRPEGAKVTVRGVPRPVVDGAITVEGEAGEVVPVVLEVGGISAEVSVAITRDGTASPSTVTGPRPPEPSTSASALALGSAARPFVPGKLPVAPGKAVPPTGGAAPPPVAPAAPDQPAIKQNKDWR
jgi:serine/threonine protein kinase